MEWTRTGKGQGYKKGRMMTDRKQILGMHGQGRYREGTGTKTNKGKYKVRTRTGKGEHKGREMKGLRKDKYMERKLIGNKQRPGKNMERTGRTGIGRFL